MKRLRHFFGCWPIGEIGFDGLSAEARCAFCGKEILMDSNGGWF